MGEFDGTQYAYYWSTLHRSIVAIQKADKNSIILLHACAHNPTGVDPTQDQWNEISKTIKVFPPFRITLYMAYLGILKL